MKGRREDQALEKRGQAAFNIYSLLSPHAGCYHLSELLSNQKRLPLAEVQVTLSAAKIGARVGGVHEKARPGGICLCINRREDQGTWGLAREDARESARNHTRGRP